ncbi:MAG: hypothetical protein ACI9N9_002446, partial [Enterobacterales bacterium]
FWRKKIYDYVIDNGTDNETDNEEDSASKPDEKSYLSKEQLLKLTISLAVFCSAVSFLLFGEYYQQFLELVILFIEIINQK